MMVVDPDERKRLLQYLSLRGELVNIKAPLGNGTDGAVWATHKDTAIKVFRAERGYLNERDTYLRLAEFGITESLDGFWVPKMHDYDDDLLVVEMDLMQHPPDIIDFAKVKLNSSPDFPEQTLVDIEADGQEKFDDNWPAVKSLLVALESFQIYYLDPSPYNIVFPERP